MTSAPNLLFPYILDALSQKPQMREVQPVLLKNIRDQLQKEGFKVKNLKRELEATIDMGKNVGVFTVWNEIVRMPYLLKNPRDVNLTRSTNDVSDYADSDTRNKSVPRTAKKATMSLARGRSKNASNTKKHMARSHSGPRSRSSQRSRRVSRGRK